ncbi:hypothetical protein [Anaerotruncus rubiinfantis]|uniref:hypothetical protein n=1 Tax=Anaerotruncus rubiinfantis TaxID=1720200 RepID=UPI003D79B48D
MKYPTSADVWIRGYKTLNGSLNDTTKEFLEKMTEIINTAYFEGVEAGRKGITT